MDIQLRIDVLNVSAHSRDAQVHISCNISGTLLPPKQQQYLLFFRRQSIGLRHLPAPNAKTTFSSANS